MDFAPTFLDLAGISTPQSFRKSRPGPLQKQEQPRQMTIFRGREVHAIRGKSLVPLFGRGEKAEDNEMWAVHSSQEPFGWELFSRAALRKGDWKIVHIPRAYGGVGENYDGWELFNVVEDPGETTDVGEAKPEKLKELLGHWEEYVVECGVVWGEVARARGLSKEEAPQLWEDELDLQKSWMGAKGGHCPDSCV